MTTENDEQDNFEPAWHILTLEEVEAVRAFVNLARVNKNRLTSRWQKEFVRGIGKIVNSTGEVKLSVRQISSIARIHKKLAPRSGDPTKVAIVSAALDLLEMEMSRIEIEITLLEKLKAFRLSQVREKFAAVEGGWAVEDFAERLMQTYWNFPDIRVDDLLSLFGTGMKSITQIPEQYRQIPSGFHCEMCQSEIYISSRSASFKCVYDQRSGGPKRVCDSCHYEQQESLEYCADGTVRHYRGSSLIETYNKNSGYMKTRPENDSENIGCFLEAGPSPSHRERELARMPYADYLQSAEWAEIRRKAYARAGYKCQVCGKQDKLNVHHNNYPPRGTESPRDLLVMCESCHQKFHDVIPIEAE
ncbi:MAG TPA: HNH endonuclease signature motif containing protein [Acidocella sp.]|uniref:HNH endonuclease n=1 Tax=Acidocella sp. TaxID=50710 RepID=UPI002BCEEB01|nr:HNH endonuclease signature motif containing protein [Acidocella sp.]HVE23098.1 HNH endonuclease signature motif containing protein [Acidocella sp.]